MKKYKCIKDFVVNSYDENGLLIEKTFEIKKGTTWKDRTNDMPITIGEYYLERKTNDKLQWIGITKETLEKCFEEVKHENN